MLVFVLLACACAGHAREFVDKMDRYVIACHSTDFTCFKRQYAALRDGVLLGNHRLAIGRYEPYSVQYGRGCVRLSGWAESELVGIGMDSTNKELTMALELPVYIQQVKSDTNCVKPEREFTDIETHAHIGTLMKFTANATVTVTFPYRLLKRKGDVYLMLGGEEVDALMDIPVYVLDDNEPGNKNKKLATELNEASDWAYNFIQHVEAANDFAAPFTGRIRTAFERIPFRRLMLLYPEEDYSDLQFAFIDPLI